MLLAGQFEEDEISTAANRSAMIIHDEAEIIEAGRDAAFKALHKYAFPGEGSEANATGT